MTGPRPFGAWKDKIIGATLERLHLPEDRQRPRGKRYGVIAPRLGPCGWHGPRSLVPINLVPARADDFAGARRRKDQKFQGAGRDRLSFAQAREKCR